MASKRRRRRKEERRKRKSERLAKEMSSNDRAAEELRIQLIEMDDMLTSLFIDENLIQKELKDIESVFTGNSRDVTMYSELQRASQERRRTLHNVRQRIERHMELLQTFEPSEEPLYD